jgi:hypothetical protein
MRKAEGWVPFREVLYRWGRNEQGRLGYRLWAIKPITHFDPDDCDHSDSDDWWDFDFDPGGDGDAAWLN